MAMAVCSVCLDSVAEGEGRSTATLACGHAFHLDCIGSAFNAKGRMQCPNCRGVERGQWLYANACCIKEHLVEESILHQETGVNRTAGVSELIYPRWCPHQGLYGHISLSQEEAMNHEHGYADSRGNRWQICPYLVSARNIPRHSTHPENAMPVRSYYVDGRRSQSATRRVNHSRHERIALSGNASWMSHGSPLQPYEISIQSFNRNAPISHANQSPLMFGFLLEGYQFAYSRSERAVTINQPSQNVYDQVNQPRHRHSHPLSSGLASSLQLDGRRARHDEVIRMTTRHSHDYNSQRAQNTEHLSHGQRSWVAPYTSQHWNVMPDIHGVCWANVAPSVSYPVAHYWSAWAPFGTTHRHRATNPSRSGRQLGGNLRVVS